MFVLVEVEGRQLAIALSDADVGSDNVGPDDRGDGRNPGKTLSVFVQRRCV